MSEQKKNNKYRRNRNYNRNKNNSKSDQNGRKNNRNSNRKRFHKPRVSEIDKLEKAHLVALEKYFHARRKYHDQFFKVSKDQQTQLEKNLSKALGELRDFEKSIPEEHLATFQKKGNFNSLDLTYSSNHELSPEHINVELPDEEMTDPHLLETQINASYKGDTEESMGSMDDYHKYKND